MKESVCTFAHETEQANALALDSDVCPMHSALWASGIGHTKTQRMYIGLVQFHSQK